MLLLIPGLLSGLRVPQILMSVSANLLADFSFQLTVCSLPVGTKLLCASLKQADPVLYLLIWLELNVIIVQNSLAHTSIEMEFEEVDCVLQPANVQFLIVHAKK